MSSASTRIGPTKDLISINIKLPNLKINCKFEQLETKTIEMNKIIIFYSFLPLVW